MTCSPFSHSGPMVILSTGSLFHLPLEEIAAMAAASGFDGLELMVESEDLEPGKRLSDLDRVCPVRSIHAPFRRWSRWGGHLKSWQATTRMANTLPHATHVTLHPPGLAASDLIHYRWFKKAEDVPRLLGAENGLDFSLENLPWGPRSPLGRDPLRGLLALISKKNMGMTFDVCHMGFSGRDVLASIRQVSPELLLNVHFSDLRDYDEHLFPGEGDLPLDEFLDHLAEAGYRGYVTVELCPAAFPSEPDRIVAKLAGLRERMGERLRPAPAVAETGS